LPCDDSKAATLRASVVGDRPCDNRPFVTVAKQCDCPQLVKFSRFHLYKFDERCAVDFPDKRYVVLRLAPDFRESRIAEHFNAKGGGHVVLIKKPLPCYRATLFKRLEIVN